MRACEKELKALYSGIKEDIEKRLEQFKINFKNTCSDALFAELSFCTFTPQSKARSCWKAVEHLRDSGLLYSAGKDELSQNIRGVRFHKNKSGYLVRNRALFYSMDFKKFIIESSRDVRSLRKWLSDNICGYSMKEASHFLRNIGMGEEIAILDRHILKNMKLCGVIDDIPKSITERVYLELEEKLLGFSRKMKIPPDRLDILLWYKETGEIFK